MEKDDIIRNVIEYIISEYADSGTTGLLLGATMTVNDDGSITLVQRSGRTTVYSLDGDTHKIIFKVV